jgi:hypothetical protein
VAFAGEGTEPTTQQGADLAHAVVSDRGGGGSVRGLDRFALLRPFGAKRLDLIGEHEDLLRRGLDVRAVVAREPTRPPAKLQKLLVVHWRIFASSSRKRERAPPRIRLWGAQDSIRAAFETLGLRDFPGRTEFAHPTPRIS